MIGGADIVFECDGVPAVELVRQLLTAIAAEWPAALVQDANTSVAYPLVPCDTCQGQAHVVTPPEFFVYANHRAFNSWNKSGATRGNGWAMIHALVDGDALTLVADDWSRGVALTVKLCLTAFVAGVLKGYATAAANGGA